MRVVIQRVTKAEVVINGAEKRSAGQGLLILAGFENADTADDVVWLAKKAVNLRIFNDDNGVMNLSLNDIGGDVMIVSQFTLHAKTKKGNRPSYIHAAPPGIAVPLYESFVDEVRKLIKGKAVTGEFGAHMEISLVNDGPVTIVIDTKNKE